MLPPAAQLLAAQVDVSVELLSVLHGDRGRSKNKEWPREAGGLPQRASDLFHEEVVLPGTLVHFKLQHGDVRDDAVRRCQRRCDVKAPKTFHL